MTNGDSDGDDAPLSSDFDVLLSVIAALCPDRLRVSLPPAGYHGQMIFLGNADDLEIAHIGRAVRALADVRADAFVDAEAVVKLLSAIERHGHYHEREAQDYREAVIAYANSSMDAMRRWLSASMVDNDHRSLILNAFPSIRRAPDLIECLIDRITDIGRYMHGIEELLLDVGPTSIAQARRLILALNQRAQDDRSASRLTDTLFAAIGRDLGWNAWASLQAILRVCPAYAAPDARFTVVEDRTVSRATYAARAELAANIEPQAGMRAVASIYLDGFGSSRHDGLLSRPAEVRAAYVEALDNEIGENPELRHAVIEALLWNAGARVADLAQFAAMALARPEDRDFMIELEEHPDRVVCYAARAVRAARYGETLSVRALPAAGGLAQSIAALEGGVTPSDEPARTWLGDRAVERLIEQTIAAEEARFAREYKDHGDEGEDRLLSSLFGALAMRFGDLDQLLESLARTTSARRRASVSLRYRNVDRAEEGGEGIRDTDSFSADLCLIVDPSLDGVSLGRRVTLIQAKRLYRYHGQTKKKKAEVSWHGSFALDADQMSDLLKQTHSSVYVFHGPPLGGRGVPVIPTQLVSALANHQGSGGQLSTDMVATASRSLADWLTYDALALRTGDLYQDLVEKAEGRAGSLPRRLLALPTVEAEIAIITRDLDL